MPTLLLLDIYWNLFFMNVYFEWRWVFILFATFLVRAEEYELWNNIKEKKMKRKFLCIFQLCIKSFFKYMKFYLTKCISSSLWCFLVSLASCFTLLTFFMYWIFVMEWSKLLHTFKYHILFILCAENQDGNQYLERVI